ncbi:MAG: primosomal protein DnaI [Bacilli bacterium]
MKSMKNFIDPKMDNAMKKQFLESCTNKDFEKFVSSFQLSNDKLIKYTSKLNKNFKECKNCSVCTSVNCCQNEMKGYKYSGKKIDEKLHFKYVVCNKSFKENKENAYKKNIILFDGSINEDASLKNIYTNDLNRKEILLFCKKFLDDYKTNKHIKGAYIHGSFGSGKTFIISSLINELAKNEVKCVFVHFPEFLRTLKASFNEQYGYERKFTIVKNCDVLVLDDIGAETVTQWARDEILGTILQYRMTKNLPTFFTSNFSILDLEVHLSSSKNSDDILKAKRIIERIKFLTKEIVLISQNNRK